MGRITADGAAPPTAWLETLETTLERTINALVRAPRTRDGRSLLAEARRLRDVVAKWRAVPPDPFVRDELLGRILSIAKSAGTADGGVGGEKGPPFVEQRAQKRGAALGRVPLVKLPTANGVAASAGGREASPPPAPQAKRDEAQERASGLVATPLVIHTVEPSEPVDPQLVVVTDPYSPAADAYRTLRRKLQERLGRGTTGAGSAARVVAVTSPRLRDGKTALALNLALALRESARTPVLLVEANVQTPVVGAMLRFDPPECFLAQLARNANADREPRSWVVAEPFPKLHVLAIDAQASRAPLLDPIAFATGMEAIRDAGYEHIIIDAAPVLGSADTTVISDAVDGIVLSAVLLRSRRRELEEAIAQLEPAPILGVVVLDA
jgi:Mrp family chromosome partitioning ATPase